MIRTPVVRSFLLNSLLFLSAITSHHLAGGDIKNLTNLCMLSIITLIIFCIKSPKNFSGPSLATTLLLFQLIGHMALNTKSTSETRMLISHTVALFVTYKIIEKFEEIESGIYDLFFQALIPLRIIPINVKEFSIEVVFENLANFKIKFLKFINQGQAPPSLICA